MSPFWLVWGPLGNSLSHIAIFEVTPSTKVILLARVIPGGLPRRNSTASYFVVAIVKLFSQILLNLGFIHTRFKLNHSCSTRCESSYLFHATFFRQLPAFLKQIIPVNRSYCLESWSSTGWIHQNDLHLVQLRAHHYSVLKFSADTPQLNDTIQWRGGKYIGRNMIEGSCKDCTFLTCYRQHNLLISCFNWGKIVGPVVDVNYEITKIMSVYTILTKKK